MDPLSAEDYEVILSFLVRTLNRMLKSTRPLQRVYADLVLQEMEKAEDKSIWTANFVKKIHRDRKVGNNTELWETMHEWFRNSQPGLLS